MSVYHVSADDIPAVAISEKCIVLDLDQTLIATQDAMSQLADLKILSDPQLLPLRSRIYYISIENLEHPGAGTKYNFWGIARPHAREFLMFCFSYFKVVAVWSAGKRPYVEAIVDHLFQGLPQPHVIFTHDDIVTRNGHIIKPLTKMIESNPVLRKYMSLLNTLALDDNSGTYQSNTGNGVLIPAYDPPLTISAIQSDDHALLQFKYWLLQPEVVNSRDVTTLDKSKIFTTSLDTYKKRLGSISGYKFAA
jgi:hypothetical protein